MSILEKENSINFPDELKEYFINFDHKSDMIDNKITELEKEIEEINKKIETNELTLKEKVSQIDSKRKEVNIKLHGISGDYNEEDLLSAADLLKSLKEEKDTVQEELENEHNSLKEELKLSETNKKETVDVKEKISELRKNAEKTLLDTYQTCKTKINAINAAVEVCDNDNLIKALEEETNDMKEALDELSTKSNEELDKIVNLIEPDNNHDSFDKISFDKKEEKKEIKKEQKKEKAIKEEPKIELENPEPKFSEISEEKIEVSAPNDIVPDTIINEKINEEETNEIPMPTVTKEEIDKQNREIISRVDAHEKAELVKNSQAVRNSIEKFFSRSLEN